MAYFLNFDINSFAVPLWVYLLVVLVGIVSPLLAAIYPIWRGSGVSVRQALSDFGVSQTAFGNHLIDRVLTRFSGGSRLLLMSIRNSFRRRTRLVLTLLTLSAGGLFFMTALNVRASMINTLDQLFAARKFDLQVGFTGPQPLAKLENAVRKTPGVTRFEGWFATEGSVVDNPQSKSPGNPPSANGLHDNVENRGRFTVIALPAETQLLQLNIIEGRGLLASDTDALVINDALARREPQLKVGNIVVIRMGPGEANWRIVGVARETFSPAVAYAPLSFFSERNPGMVNSLRLALDKTDADSIDMTKALLEKNLESEGIRARGSASNADSRIGFDQHMLMIYIFLIIMSVIVGGVGTLGLMTTMSLNIMERRREIAVMRAIGATAGIVSVIVIIEGLAIGLMSWIIAALAAWPISRGLGNLMVRFVFTNGLHFKFEWRGLLIWLAVSLIASLVATVIPAWKTSQTTIREGLAYE